MLILLTTVFFEASCCRSSASSSPQPFSWIGYLLPASYGVELLRASMLSGVFRQPELLAMLAVYALVLGVVGWLGVSRRLRHD